MLVDSFPAYSEAWLATQVTNLEKKGHSVVVFPRKPNYSFQFDGRFIRDIVLNNIAAEPIPKNKLRRILCAMGFFIRNIRHGLILLRTLNFLKYKKEALDLTLFYQVVPFLKYADRIDVLHAHYGSNGIKILLLKELGLFTKIPFITTFHGHDTVVHDSQYYEPLFSKRGFLTVNSNYLRDKLIKLGADVRGIVKIPMSLNPEYLAPYTKTAPQGNRPLKILSVGRLVEVKGYEIALEALALLAQSGVENWEYVIVGEGYLKDSLCQYAAQLNLGNKVVFAGQNNYQQVYQHYGEADVFLLSGVTTLQNEEETQGVVILEAQAMQLPVIVSNTGGCAEGLIDGETGFLVPQRRPELISEKLALLLGDMRLRHEMGLKGRQYVAQNYDINMLNDRLLAVYCKAISD